MVLVVVGLIGWWIFYAPADASGCAKNLDEIRTHCEMYATDNSGRYPKGIESLGSWTCPNAGTDTYTSTYSLDPKTKTFSFRCSDDHWKSLGFQKGFPRCESDSGWVVSPGNYTLMRPDEYVELHSNPKL